MNWKSLWMWLERCAVVLSILVSLYSLRQCVQMRAELTAMHGPLSVYAGPVTPLYYVVSCGPVVCSRGEDRTQVRMDGEANLTLLINPRSTLILWEKDLNDTYRPVERKDGEDHWKPMGPIHLNETNEPPVALDPQDERLFARIQGRVDERVEKKLLSSIEDANSEQPQMGAITFALISLIGKLIAKALKGAIEVAIMAAVVGLLWKYGWMVAAGLTAFVTFVSHVTARISSKKS